MSREHVNLLRNEIKSEGATDEATYEVFRKKIIRTFMDVVDKISSSTEMVDRACRVAKSRKILKNGDKIIITAGVPRKPGMSIDDLLVINL